MPTRGRLLIACAAAVVVIAVIGAVAAFLALRPSATPSATTTGVLVNGTYHGTVTAAGQTIQSNVTAKSECPDCAVTITADGVTGTYNRDGDGWKSTGNTMCGPFVSTIVATKVNDGVAQELKTQTAWTAPPAACAMATAIGSAPVVLTRTGD